MKNQSLTSPTPTPPVETGRFFICINMVYDDFSHIYIIKLFEFSDRVSYLMNHSKEEIYSNNYIQIWKDYGRLYKKI